MDAAWGMIGCLLRFKALITAIRAASRALSSLAHRCRCVVWRRGMLRGARQPYDTAVCRMPGVRCMRTHLLLALRVESVADEVRHFDEGLLEEEVDVYRRIPAVPVHAYAGNGEVCSIIATGLGSPPATSAPGLCAPLSAARCLLHVVCRSRMLSAARCPLHVVRCTLSAACCPLHVV